MITTIDIYRAISERLKASIPDVTMQIKDVKNIIEPCFYIQFVSSSDSEIATDTANTICTFNIVYFSEKKTLLDLLQIKKKILGAFKKPLRVEYLDLYNNTQVKYLNPLKMGVSINETDYFLTLNLDFDFIQDDEVENPYDEYRNDEFINELLINRRETI